MNAYPEWMHCLTKNLPRRLAQLAAVRNSWRNSLLTKLAGAIVHPKRLSQKLSSLFHPFSSLECCQYALKKVIPWSCGYSKSAHTFSFAAEPLSVEPTHLCTLFLQTVFRFTLQKIVTELFFTFFIQEERSYLALDRAF